MSFPRARCLRVPRASESARMGRSRTSSPSRSIRRRVPFLIPSAERTAAGRVSCPFDETVTVDDMPYTRVECLLNDFPLTQVAGPLARGLQPDASLRSSLSVRDSETNMRRLALRVRATCRGGRSHGAPSGCEGARNHAILLSVWETLKHKRIDPLSGGASSGSEGVQRGGAHTETRSDPGATM